MVTIQSVLKNRASALITNYTLFMAAKFPFIKSVSFLLNIIWYLQWLLLAAIVIISILIATDNKIINTSKIEGFHIQFARIDIPNDLSSSDIQNNAVYLSHGEGRLHIENYQNNFIYLRLLSAFLYTLIYIIIIYLLRKIFFSLKTGLFFVKQNGIYIRKIAFAVLGITLIPAILNLFINIYVKKTLIIEGIIFKAQFEFDYGTAFLALLIFVIAEVFIRGTELKEDQALTI
jgi:hypothetical protein